MTEWMVTSMLRLYCVCRFELPVGVSWGRFRGSEWEMNELKDLRVANTVVLSSISIFTPSIHVLLPETHNKLVSREPHPCSDVRKRQYD